MKSIIASGLLSAWLTVLWLLLVPTQTSNRTPAIPAVFDGSVIEIHKGYEGELGENGSWFVQGGPAIIAEDGEDAVTEFSGKVGASYDVSEAVEIYGE